MKVHSVRFDHQYNYFAAYNTTDSAGWSSFISIISQFSSMYSVQYYFNLHTKIHDCQGDQDKHDFIQKTLMVRRKEQSMKNSSWRDHKTFLEYWRKTHAKSTYEEEPKKKN